jgi:hypothetical protein
MFNKLDSSSGFAVITPGASQLTYGGLNATTRGIILTVAGTVTCTNDAGASVAVPVAAGIYQPISTNYITAVSGGTCVALF